MAVASPASSPKRGRQNVGWRSFWFLGIMIVFLALLVMITHYLLPLILNTYAALLDKRVQAEGLMIEGENVVLFGLMGFILQGGLLLAISSGLAEKLEEKRRGRVRGMGWGAGVCRAIGSVLGLLPFLLGRNMAISVVYIYICVILFVVLVEMVPVLLLIFWTRTLAEEFRVQRGLSRVGVIGLCLVLLWMLCWSVNEVLPVEARLYGTVGILSVLAIVGQAFWLLWLIGFGLHVLVRGGAREARERAEREMDRVPEQRKRRSFLKAGMRLGVGLVGGVFVLGYSGLTIAGAPITESDQVPSMPSFLGALFFWGILVPRRYLQGVQSFKQMHAQTHETVQEPAGVAVEHLSVGGVASTLYRAPGASSERFILYLHGGGLILPITNVHRTFCARLSQETGASVLLPEYRLAPEHPYPIPLEDCLAAYHWIREQGVVPAKIAIAGESGGGYLTIATVLSLKEKGEELPAAIVPISAAVLEPTFSGTSYSSKALVDPVVTIDLARESLAAYTDRGKIDPRNPLISPLYADLRGLPPTLMQVGSQEVFLSDNVNFARRAQAAGSAVQLEVWPGMFHAFPSLIAVLPIPDAMLAFQHIVKFMKQHLGN